jgi:hypothetical protein
VRSSINRDFDRTFANQQHLVMRMTVGRVRCTAWRRHGLVDLDPLARRGRSAHDWTELVAVKSLYWELIEGDMAAPG